MNNIKQIVRDHLIKNEFDGLKNKRGDCYCFANQDLMKYCKLSDKHRCTPGHKFILNKENEQYYIK